ncbi:MAG: type II toxin-antitoxin system PemK/MazF family toxin [Aquimonas sp.]|nr:type II toxin-antitoxin system PemK/MazF family toxin [Aquimonas sp.]
MKRGALWWANLPEPSGSGLDCRHYVVIVQINPFKDSRITTVIVAAVTSNPTLADVPGKLRLARSGLGLSKPPGVNLAQNLMRGQRLLAARIKLLPANSLARLEERLRVVAL